MTRIQYKRGLWTKGASNRHMPIRADISLLSLSPVDPFSRLSRSYWLSEK